MFQAKSKMTTAGRAFGRTEGACNVSHSLELLVPANVLEQQVQGPESQLAAQSAQKFLIDRHH